MTELRKKYADNKPVFEEEGVQVVFHGKKGKIAEKMFLIQPSGAEDKSFVDYLDSQAEGEGLRRMFNALSFIGKFKSLSELVEYCEGNNALIKQYGSGKFEGQLDRILIVINDFVISASLFMQSNFSPRVFALVNSRDPLINTDHVYSSSATPHMHVIAGDLEPGMDYIEEERTFALRRNECVDDAMRDVLKGKGSPLVKWIEQKGCFRVYRVDSTEAEAPEQIFIASTKFKNFKDFVARADEQDYVALHRAVRAQLERLNERGGARFIVNERFSPIKGGFSVQILGGDLGGKWFEKKKKTPPASPQPATA